MKALPIIAVSLGLSLHVLADGLIVGGISGGGGGGGGNVYSNTATVFTSLVVNGNISASNLLSPSNLSSSVAPGQLLASNGTNFSGSYNGGSLTNLNATNITGTFAPIYASGSARILDLSAPGTPSIYAHATGPSPGDSFLSLVTGASQYWWLFDYNGSTNAALKSGPITADGVSVTSGSQFHGNGAGLTNLSASQITGTLGYGQLPPAITTNSRPLYAELYEAQKWNTPVHVLENAGWGSDVGVQEPNVWVNGNKLSMVYSGLSTNTSLCYLGYAESATPTNFLPQPTPCIGNGYGGEPGQALHSFVTSFGGVDYCYFTTNVTGSGIERYATSTDGSNWTSQAVCYNNTWTMGNFCVVSNPANGLFYAAMEYHLNGATWVSGMATSSVPTGPFKDFLPVDPTLDVGLGSYSVGHIQNINGTWQNWHHVGFPTYVVRSYTTNANLTNWVTDPSSPLFTPNSFTTHGYGCDQVADAKSEFGWNGATYIYFDCLTNGNFLEGSILMSSYADNLTNLVAPGVSYPINRPINMTLTTNLPVQNNSAATVVFDNTVTDDGVIYNALTGEYVCTTPGAYSIEVVSGFGTPMTAGSEQQRILKNGAIVFLDSWPANGNAAMTSSHTLRLTAGDKLKVQVFENSGATNYLLGITSGIVYSSATLKLIGQ